MNEIKLINDLIGVISDEIGGSIKRVRIFKKMIKSLKKRGADYEKCESEDPAWTTAKQEVEQGKETVAEDD